MHVLKVGAENFLSFDKFELDPRRDLTVIVGPNGSGKSNLARIFRMVREAVLSLAAGKRPSGWEGASRQKPPAEFKVWLELEFNDCELELWKLFFEAYIASLPPVREHLEAFERFTEASRKRVDAYCEWLRCSRLEVEFTGPPGNFWGVRLHGKNLGFGYRSAHVAVAFRTNAPGSLPASYVEPWDYLGTKLNSEGAALAGKGLEKLIELAEGENKFISFYINLTALQSDSDLYRKLTAEFKSTNNMTNFVHVLERILANKLFITENIRSWPETSYSSGDLTGPIYPQADGRNLALYLFRLKNDPEPGRRQLYSQICKIFKGLSGATLDVSVESVREGGEQAAGQLKLTVLVRRNDREFPVGFAGAGIWELLVLSVLLAQPGALLVLDEPGLNLHPTLQRALLARLCARTAQTVLITHSPYLIPTRKLDDLQRLVRFELKGGRTLKHVWTKSGVDKQTLRMLALNPEARALLFAERVILVEGDTELGALQVWLEEHRWRQNIAVYSVGGDKNFTPMIALLKQLGIPWKVLCDGKVLDPNHKDWIFKQLEKAGVLKNSDRTQLEKIKAQPEQADLFQKVTELAGRYGVHTLVENFDEEFEDWARRKYPSLIEEAGTIDLHKSKVNLGRFLADRTELPEELRRILDV